MKKIFAVVLCVLLIFLLGLLPTPSGMAQQDSPQEKPAAEKKTTKKKPAAKKKPADEVPDPAELQKAMEELSQGDPEAARLMKEMGIAEKAKKAQEILKNAKPGDLQTGDIPRKDVARIAKLRKTILADAEVKPFLQQTHAAVEQRISPKARKIAEQIYQNLHTRKPGAASLAVAASGLWMQGAQEPALYLMGRAALEAPTNPDHLNNYAAFLTMAGKEEAALPLLQKLNQKYPQNSTILNNIGQAWFGLGDVDEAEKHLDGAIKLFAYHSQANFTKCLIQRSKGNTQAAVSAMKHSIRGGFTQEKQNRLRQLGSHVEKQDIPWPFHMPQDPLGLHLFQVPAYAKSVDEAAVLGPEWNKFKDDARKLREQLEAKVRTLSPSAEQQGNQRLNRAIAIAQAGRSPLPMLLPPFAAKATLKMALLAEQMAIQNKLWTERFLQASAQIATLKEQHQKSLHGIKERHEEDFGEGQDSTGEALCAELTAENNEYLRAVNTLHEKIQNEELNNVMRQINERTYFAQYIAFNADFEIAKANAKSEFLNSLVSLAHEVAPKCKASATKKVSQAKLANFNDLHCDTHIALEMILTSMKFDCDKSTFKYNAIFIEGEHVEDLNTGKIISGSVEILISTGIGKGVELGPVKIEARAGVGAFIEYGDTGVTDVGPMFVATAEAAVNWLEGTDPSEFEVGHEKEVAVGGPPDSVEASVEGRWGWNSSASLTGKGILSGMGGHGE